MNKEKSFLRAFVSIILFSSFYGCGDSDQNIKKEKLTSTEVILYEEMERSKVHEGPRNGSEDLMETSEVVRQDKSFSSKKEVVEHGVVDVYAISSSRESITDIEFSRQVRSIEVCSDRQCHPIELL